VPECHRVRVPQSGTLGAAHNASPTILGVQKFRYEIPDLEHPFPPEDTSDMGPSGPLKPFVPEPLDPSQIVGREIDEWIPHAGTYGMGGPGFLGFRIGDDWLIVAIWGAGNWFRLDGRLLTDMFWERHERSMPWQAVPNVDFQNLFVGRRFTALEVTRDSVTARFDNGQVLTLSPDPGDRPPHEGNGEPRGVGPDDDLRQAIFLAPTPELWID
jgi:hypothetical protein